MEQPPCTFLLAGLPFSEYLILSFLEYTNIDIIMQLVYLCNLSHLFQSIIIAAFKIQVINTSAKKKENAEAISEFFILHQQYIGKKKTGRDLAETFVYYVSNGFDILWYFAKGNDLVF